MRSGTYSSAQFGEVLNFFSVTPVSVFHFQHHVCQPRGKGRGGWNRLRGGRAADCKIYVCV